MAESLAEFFSTHFEAHRLERAYGQRRGYRMEWFTYGQVLEMASRFARELEGRQIGKGDRIMLWGENCAEWVAAFFGCTLRGAVVVPMDNGASADFAARVFRQVEAKLLVCSRPHARGTPNEFAAIASALILEDLPQALANRHATPSHAAALGCDDILQIVFTSGTTTEPKGVVITHGNVLANIAPLEKEMRGYLKYERFVHPVRFLNLLPLSHVFGQFLGLFLPPLLGGTVIFQEELKPSEIIGTIRRERISVLVSVPRVLQSLKQKIERDLEDRSKEDQGKEDQSKEDQGKMNQFQRQFRFAEGKHFLRRWWIFRNIRRQFGWKFLAFICGGAALDAETEEFWGRLGYAAIQGYGLTETTSLISVNHPFKLGKGSIGKVLPGREVELAEDGEILVRGGGVAAAYWDSSGRHDLTGDQGWYRTGDVGALDETGNLYFKGRKKEVIVTPAGLNIYPEDLEAALRRQPEIKDCAVVGIERGGNDRGGNAEPCAVVILRGVENDQANSTPNFGASVEGDVEKIVQRANQSLAEYQHMRMWLHWPLEDFPRTSTQKPRKNLIQEVVQNHFLAPDSKSGRSPTPGASSAPLAELITRVVGRPIPGLQPTANLDSDLGLSSLDRVELLGALEDRYQVDLSETRFSSVRTVDDLEGMLRGQPPQKTAYHYPRWTLRWPATWLRFAAHYLFLRPAIILLGWPRIEGRENLRGVTGPLLVVCNHIADVDFAFVQTALPARFRHRLSTATRGEDLEALRTPPPSRGVFASIYDRMLWFLGVCLLNLFPLPREAGFRQSFAYAGEAVDRGYSVLIFPEGRHTVDGNINSFRAGIGLLANNLSIPILPMRIVGLFEVKRAGKRFAAPWKIRVRIGEPVKFAPGTDPGEIAAALQRAVELL
ncbi:MAG: AMP-binding protein [Candidatus Sulfotelmatobacter sp.]